MWFIFSTCILSAHRRLQVLAAEMKDSPEDRRDALEYHGNGVPLIRASENVHPPPSPLSQSSGPCLNVKAPC